MNENFMFRKGCLGFLFEICLCLHCCIKLSVWKLDRVFDLMVREHEIPLLLFLYHDLLCQ